MVLLADIAKRENRAVLAVTHDPRTLPYADRIVRIEDGLIVGEKRQKVKVFGPVLLSGKLRNPRSMSSHSHRAPRISSRRQPVKIKRRRAAIA